MTTTTILKPIGYVPLLENKEGEFERVDSTIYPSLRHADNVLQSLGFTPRLHMWEGASEVIYHNAVFDKMIVLEVYYGK